MGSPGFSMPKSRCQPSRTLVWELWLEESAFSVTQVVGTIPFLVATGVMPHVSAGCQLGSPSASPGHSRSSPCGPLQLQSQGVMELQAFSCFQSRTQLIMSGPPRSSPCHELSVGRTLITPVKSLHSTNCIRV